jgi:hypothetical protein
VVRVVRVERTAENVEGSSAWDWDGNVAAPTLKPSISIVGECGWHGYLTGGEWIKV